VSDPTAEALFVRDDESGECWSPTLAPMSRGSGAGQCVVRHAPGLTHVARVTHGIAHELDVFVHVGDPVKFSLLTIANTGFSPRRLSVFAYNEWVLGPPRDGHHLQVVTERDEATGAIFATKAYNQWAVLSGAVPQRFAERAMDAVRSVLVSRGARIMPLLDPPFDRSAQDPGYIKAYPPGVRENGGQYTHAAVWVVMALARLGSGDEAAELFHMLNPINHTRTGPDVLRYKTEPFAVAGDVYARAPHAGRGGWSWYTGSAAWMYRAGLESMLGLRRHGAAFSVNPCIPSSWPEYTVIWRFLSTRYEIVVTNPHRRCRGVVGAELDGMATDWQAIPLVDDGRVHHLRVMMGEVEDNRSEPVGRHSQASRGG
jgi:cellobiose phosphorylase